MRLAADPPPEPPPWWGPHFHRRQADCRVRLLRALASLPDDRWLVTHNLVGRAYAYDRLEVEHCLAALALDGLVQWHRVREKVQAQGSRLTDRDYWRLAPGGAR